VATALASAAAPGRGRAPATDKARSSRDVLERERILDVALGLLLERGPGRMRLADLARVLGVVPSALHYHFPGGKEEVVAALFDREEARLLEAMTATVAAAGTPRSQLHALATARVQNAARMARLYRSGESREDTGRDGGAAATEIQEYVRRRRQGFLDSERHLIAGIFREVAGPHVSVSSIGLLAVAFQGALFNATRMYSLTPSRKSNRVLAELVDLFFRGVERSR
jgi:AcrR family transcriptional regulator